MMAAAADADAAGPPATALEVPTEEAGSVDATRECTSEVTALVPRAEVIHRIRGCQRGAGVTF